MPKYNRIKLKITDISPESASKVFQFLDTCLEGNDLNFVYFKKNIDDYTIGEKHFIFEYSKEYFSSSQRSYLNRWIGNLYNQLGEGEHRKQLLNYITNVVEGAKKILDYACVNEKTVERQFKALKKKKNINLYLESPLIDYRIPLYFKIKSKEEKIILKNLSIIDINKESFKRNAKNLLSEVMEERVFDIFFNNSFDYQGNIYPLELLNLEFENSSMLYSKIYDLYKYYSEEKNKQNKVIKEYYQNLVDEKKEEILKQKNIKEQLVDLKTKYILSKKAPIIESVGRFEFMQIMYNAFPQIRESYYLHLQKNPSSDRNSYLKTKSRNIK